MLMTRHSKQRTYGVEIRAFGCNLESDGILCAHCGSEEMSSRAGIPHCTCCDKFICRGCVGKGCMPLEMRLDMWERYNAGFRYLRKDRLFEIFGANGKVFR
jgi:hypothetical protein